MQLPRPVNDSFILIIHMGFESFLNKLSDFFSEMVVLQICADPALKLNWEGPKPRRGAIIMLTIQLATPEAYP